ncbi:MAG: FAD-binding oxidoreductase [bacterium]|nr:FAD-binding oxidoreductase [bacterium]
MTLYEDISKIVGEDRVSRHELDLLCYSRDLAPMPDELLRGYGMLRPKLVAKPNTIDEVKEIMKYAYLKNIPVTLRGGATFGLGGVLPMDGGLVLDLCGMRRILEFNPEDEYVRVQTGCEWKRVIDYVEARGYTIGANPSSGPSSTIGGFISTGGSGGIGTIRHGPVGDQIVGMKVVLANGELIETDPWSSWMFVGSEGTLGIILEVTLKIFKLGKRSYLMYGFDKLDDAIRALERLCELRPYFLSLIDKNLITLLNKKGHHLPEKETVFVVDGDEAKVTEICGKGIKYREGLAREEWENRYKTILSIKGLGPTIFPPELQVPIKRFYDTILDLRGLIKNLEYGIEAMVNSDGMVSVLPTILTDERKKSEYFRVCSLTRRISNIAYKNGGCVYGIGVYNTPHMSRIHGKSLKVMRRIKKGLDPKNILNPGKTIHYKIPGIFMNLSMIAMEIIPTIMVFSLELVNYVPLRLLRLGLRFVGGKMK